MLDRRQGLAVCAGVMLAAGAGSPVTGDPAPLAPTFRFAPRNAGPGSVLTVTGERFAGPSAAILAVDTRGQHAVLGMAAVDGLGRFSKTVAAPASPGPYFMVVRDANQQLAINLIGTLIVIPPGVPWFGYAPSSVAPGASVTVGGAGFGPEATAVAFGLVDASGVPTVLRTAGVSSGSFRASFLAPTSIPDGSYGAFVVSSARQVGLNLTGPMTVATGPRPPAIGVGYYPIGAAVDEAANEIWVPAAGDNTVWLLDGATDAATTSIAVGGLPCAITLGGGRVYVANVNTSDVSVLDTATRSVLATVPVGDQPCAAAALPALGRVYIGNYGSDTVSVIDTAANAVVATIPVGNGPFGLAANPGRGLVYVTNGYDDSLSVIDGVTGTVLTTVPVGRDPDAVAVDPSTNRVYVANYLSANVTVVDGDANAVIATVPVGRQPSAVAVNPATGRVYVANYESNTVSVLDGSTNAVVATIPVGTTPDGLAVNARTGRVYVVNSNTNDVSVITDTGSPR
jgi:YVTN family beta-propeller protein